MEHPGAVGDFVSEKLNIFSKLVNPSCWNIDLYYIITALRKIYKRMHDS